MSTHLERMRQDHEFLTGCIKEVNRVRSTPELCADRDDDEIMLMDFQLRAMLLARDILVERIDRGQRKIWAGK